MGEEILSKINPNRPRGALNPRTGDSKVFALVADFPIQPCELSHTPPPAVRTLNLSRKTFVERPKFVQGLFQRLGVVFLFTRAECQIRVFHAEVCPNTLTRCWQGLCFYKVREYVEPIITARVTLYRDTTDSPFKLTVLMERISHFIMSPFTVIPFSEIEGEAIVFQKPPRLFECEGFKLMVFLDFRSTAKFLEKTDIRLINAFEFFLDCLTRQGFPMRVRRAFQIRQVGTHRSMVGIRQSISISFVLPLMEVFMRLPHIVKQIANTDTIRLIVKRIFIRLHGLSSIKRLSPS